MNTDSVNALKEIEKIYLAPDRERGREYKRGDLFYIAKTQVMGSEQQGGRPGVIVSNDTGNETSEVVEVVYLTTKSKSHLPTHVTIYTSSQVSTALCEQVWTISKKRIGNYIGHLLPEEITSINKALSISLDIHSTVSKNTLKIETNEDEVLEKVSQHINELLSLTEHRKKIKEAYSLIKDNDIFQSRTKLMLNLEELISDTSMKQLQDATCNILEKELKQNEILLLNKVGLVQVVTEETNTATTHESSNIHIVDKTNPEHIEEAVQTNSTKLTVENVTELFLKKKYTLDQTASCLDVKRSTLYTFICKNNLKRDKKKKAQKVKK